MQTLFRNRGTWNLTYIIFEKSFQCEKESIRGYLNVNVGQYCGHYKWEKQLNQIMTSLIPNVRRVRLHQNQTLPFSYIGIINEEFSLN